MSFLQIISLIIGCLTVHIFVRSMKLYKSKLYKIIYALQDSAFLIFIASVFSQSSNITVSIIRFCSAIFFFIMVFIIHAVKKHTKQLIHKNTNQLSKNIEKIHNHDKKEFSMKDAEKLRQSTLNDNNLKEQKIVHHILMQNEHYYKHFMISIEVLSHCLHISKHDIRKAIHDSFRNHPEALYRINDQIEKYNSLHPENTFQDRIDKAEQNNNLKN